MSLSDLEPLQHQIDTFLSAKLEQLNVNDEKLLAAIRYGLLIGGKRMRPYLASITGNALNVEARDSEAIGAAIECIHAYSLLHDD